MKNLAKIASVMLALFLALCFVSCKNGPTEVASFKGTVQGQEITISFYDNATISYGITGASVGGLILVMFLKMEKELSRLKVMV